MMNARTKKKSIAGAIACAAIAAAMLVGCSTTTEITNTRQPANVTNNTTQNEQPKQDQKDIQKTASSTNNEWTLDTTDVFTERDLKQVAETTNAEKLTVASGTNLTIDKEGVYIVSGSADNASIIVNADENAKVQIVLDGVTINNETAPAIYVVSADKVFVTTISNTTSTLAVSGTIAIDGEDNVDGVIFAKDDITLNGEGTLVIKSSGNGIVGKDDLKLTGGTYEITAGGHTIQGKDSVAIANGTYKLYAGKDGIHAANSDEPEKGYVYIADGTFDIQAGSDGIEGDAAVQIDGGKLTISSSEGIEGTWVELNGGTSSIEATDDGINASSKSTAYDIGILITGGDLTIKMGQGDTDALDSNGWLRITGGNIDITAQFAFDFVSEGTLSGGTVTVNGEQVDEITNSMMGGGMGGFGRQMGEHPNDGRQALNGEMDTPPDMDGENAGNIAPDATGNGKHGKGADRQRHGGVESVGAATA